MTRAQLRQVRSHEAAAVPDARTYGYVVKDPDARVWESQVVVHAANPSQARALTEAAGFSAASSQPLSPTATTGPEFDFAEAAPGVLFFRRGFDFSYGRWYRLPPDYDHRSPPPALDGEVVDPTKEFASPRWEPSPLRGNPLNPRYLGPFDSRGERG